MANLFNGARHLLPVSERDSLEKGLIKMKARREGKLRSLVSAWPKFNDAFCDGLEWKTITVVGARPGTGKTLFMEQLISDIIDLNKNEDFRVLKFQMEMVDETSAIRKFGLKTGADYNTLMSKDGKLVDKRIFQRCVDFYHESASSDIVNVVYDVCTVNEMCSTVHHELERHRREDGSYRNMLVAIDHSALFKNDVGQKDKFEMLGSLGEALTQMKKKYPVAFIVLSQLNRNIDDIKRQVEGNYGNYVLDSDIYGSDALLQHADVVMGINKPSIRNIWMLSKQLVLLIHFSQLKLHFSKKESLEDNVSFLSGN